MIAAILLMLTAGAIGPLTYYLGRRHAATEARRALARRAASAPTPHGRDVERVTLIRASQQSEPG